MKAERESLPVLLDQLFSSAADPTAGYWAELAHSLQDVLPDTARVLSRVDDDAARVVRGLLRHAALATGALRESTEARPAAIDGAVDIAAVIEAAGRFDTVDEIVHHIPSLACELGFDRAMYSRVRGGVWVTQTVYVTGDTDWAEHIRTAGSRPQLVEPLVENQVLQERRAIIMQGVQDAERVHKPIADASLCRSYVAAPVMVDREVVGLIHADHYFDPHDPANDDRDHLTAFCSGLTLAIERARAIEKVRSTEQALSGIVDGLRTVTLDLGAPGVSAPAAVGSGRRFGDLTRREDEILALMAEGRSNAAIAEQLVIAEGTVKRHVKNILHKLGANNRVEAVARWYRAG